ncbi:MAG: phosphatase PAP2 family protein [Chitinophagaceae bacterium]|nr:phosphatase PAP2 family protein [Chitinophagaceae bacterium]
MVLIPGTILLTFWQHIQPFDLWLITLINQQLGNQYLDKILPFMRETMFWTPLYLFLGLFIVANFPAKGLWWILGVVLTAALADLLSSQVIKQTIMRIRPCQDIEVASQLRFFINYCPGSSSFTSSHATSHFAQAMFFFLTLRKLSKWAWLFFLWAAIVGYTQIYVGVHYPFDVFCGGLLGCGIGYFMAKLFHKHSGLLSLDK